MVHGTWRLYVSVMVKHFTAGTYMDLEIPEIGYCQCGSAWFKIVEYVNDDDIRHPAAVTLTQEGAIAGWIGKFACMECGELWEPYVYNGPADVVSMDAYKLKRKLQS